AEAVCAAVATGGPIATIDRLRRRSAVGVGALRRLAEADAFGSMGLDRQRALWHILRLRDEPLPLFDDAPADANDRDGDNALPPVPAPRRIAHDYAATGLSLKGHPMAEHRPRLAAMGVRTADALRDERRWPHGRAGAVAGLVLLRQRPATASGVVFMTIEDETAAANLILFPKVYRRFRRAARHGAAALARGTVERQGAVVHLIVRRVEDLREVLGRPHIAAPPARDFH
ncbi:MAG: hypothetical protein KIT68_13455, partial [Phycisphaeraceae bacterium]|nr:hypothetical protein [Phycisphaeraceae bacterium]